MEEYSTEMVHRINERAKAMTKLMLERNELKEKLGEAERKFQAARAVAIENHQFLLKKCAHINKELCVDAEIEKRLKG